MADKYQTNWRVSPHSRLRNANNTLMHSLKQGQREINTILKELQSQRPAFPSSDRGNHETSFTVRSWDGTPSAVQRTTRTKDYLQNAETSTPKSYRDALVEPGNDRRSRNVETTPSSILRNSAKHRSKKTPKKGLRVSFQTDENSNVIDNDLNRRSMLGYDWIAGILDNTSYLAEKNDDFFEDLKEFRRVNKDECYSKTMPHLIQPFHSMTPSKTYAGDEDMEDGKTYTCTNTYRLNERLFAEKVHNDDVSCGVCYTKPPAEYETEGSYVRVSVPRSTLMSPYKVKPHRRASFDPTDSIGLSSHCLAGWESSKPAVVPAQTSLDLKTSIYKTKEAMNASMSGRSSADVQSTRELLDRSHSMRYGLQVLDMQRGLSDQQAHSTPYPLL